METMMKRYTLAAGLALAAIATGCATTDPGMQRAVAESTPTCTAGADCTAKMEAAQVWVATHAGWKIQTATASVIETFGPSSRAEHSTRLAVQVTREPIGGDRFQIVARIRCGNPFGCTPEVLPSALDFNRAVGAATAGGAKPIAAPAGAVGGMVFEAPSN